MMEYHVKMRLNAEQISDTKHIIHLSNGKQIEVEEQAEYNGVVWAWKVDGQYFGKDGHALDYLKRLVAEKLTGDENKAACKVCYEDVLAEILESGGKLTIYDREEDKDHELTLKKLLDGFAYYMKLTASDGRTGIDDMDAEAADQILQFAIFDAVIYG